MSLSPLDALLIVLFLFSALWGGWRGFLLTALTGIVWGGAFGVSLYFSPFLTAEIGVLKNFSYQQWGGTFLLFIGTLVGGMIVRDRIAWGLRRMPFRRLDHLCGFIFGSFRAWGLLGVLFLFAEKPLLEKSDFLLWLSPTYARVFEDLDRRQVKDMLMHCGKVLLKGEETSPDAPPQDVKLEDEKSENQTDESQKDSLPEEAV